MELKLNVAKKSVHSCREPSSESSEIRSLYRILSYTHNGSSTDRESLEPSERFGLITNDQERGEFPSDNSDIDRMLSSVIKDRLRIWNEFKRQDPFAEAKTESIKGIETSQPGFLVLRELKAQEWIEGFNDYKPFLEVRKALLRMRNIISNSCKIITTNSVFETVILLSIIVNTVALALEDPLAEEQDPALKLLDLILLYIYTVEACLKIGAQGFLFVKSAYLRDNWNVLDFIIVLTGWISLLAEGGLNLKALRTMRILRPLKSITSIQGLRVLIVAIVNSMKPLLLSMAVFMFFLCIFAIAGLQLWVGLFRYRCIDLSSGTLSEDLCGSALCPENTECTLGLDNPNFGRINFDNFYYAFLVVFQSITLEGWHTMMVMAQRVFGSFAILYFVPLVFIGAFLLLNFTLAVIKSSFTTEMDKVRQENNHIAVLLTRNLSMASSKYRNSNIFEESYSVSRDLHSFCIRNNSKMVNFQDIDRNLQTNAVVKVQGSEEESEESSNSQCFSERLNSHNFAERVNSNNFLLTTKRNLQSKGKEILREEPYFESSFSIVHDPYDSQQPAIARMMTEKFSIEYKNLIHTEEITKGPMRQLQKLEGLVSIDRFEDNLDNYKFEILGSFVWINESAEDISPPVPQETPECNGPYRFEYAEDYTNDMSDSEIQVEADFQVFSLLSFRNDPEKAFFKTNKSAEETVSATKVSDQKTKLVYGIWSVPNIYYNIKPGGYLRYNSMDFRLWAPGCRGLLQKVTYPIYILVLHRFFSNFMTMCVLLNTVVLAMDHHGISDSMEDALDNLNFAFTIIFIVEMGLKLIGLGVVGYFRDPMNYLDATVVLISIIELVFMSGTSSAISAFRTIRIFRTFRVLRVARLFRHFQSMGIIISVLSSSMKSFIYLAILLLLFIMIFALLGMQIFGGKFDFPEGKPRANFDSFHFAFVTVFQVLSLENWQDVLDSAMRSTAGHFSALYFIFWICVGNFMLLNLFLAILLDSFDQKDELEEEEEQEEELSRPNSRKSTRRLFKESKRQQRLEIVRRLELMHESEREENSADEDDISQNIEFLRSKRSLAPAKPLFHKVACEKSYYIFSQTNKLRILSYKISISNRFETLIMVMICLSSLKLVWDTYTIEQEEGTTSLIISYYLDILFTVFFTLEFLIKSISVGFIMDEGSYLRESWNVIDLFIVAFSILELAITNLNMPEIKVLRLLRTLRPLRFVSHNLSMKFVVTALLGSLFAILNVVIVLMIVWLMFAILGMSLFSGKFYSCELDSLVTQDQCEAYGYAWENADSNFDNLLEALMTLFIISSLEGWPDIMYQGIDGRDPGLAPKKNYNVYVAYYFIIFIFIGAFFMVNFFIGVVFMQFNQAKRNENSGYRLVLDKKDVKWIEMQKLIINSKPQLDVAYKPKNKVRLMLYHLCYSNYFEFFILGVILLNMFQMAILFEGASEDYIQALEYLNLAFTGIFVMEAAIKMTGLGLKAYFKSKWNRFDFLVILASIVDLLLVFFLKSDSSFLRVGPQLARVIRVLRVSRLLRIFKSLEPLQELVTIMATSLPAILNVFSLLFLLFFIYAVLGVFIFHDLEQGNIVDEYTNFNNFGMAMVALLRTSTGEEWNKLMYACAEQKGILIALAYFGSFITITMFVMLNLFIMVIVQTYEDYKSDPNSALKKFTSYVKRFKRIWAEYSAESGGIRINYQKLPNFIISLAREDQKLKVDEGTPTSVLIRMLSTMDIAIDSQGYIYYNDMLFACLKKRFKGRRYKQSTLCKKILKKEVVSTRKTLDKKRQRIIKKMRMKKVSDLRKKFARNYISSLLILRPMIRAWHKYYKERANKGKGSYREEWHPGNNSVDSPSEEISFN